MSAAISLYLIQGMLCFADISSGITKSDQNMDKNLNESFKLEVLNPIESEVTSNITDMNIRKYGT